MGIVKYIGEGLNKKFNIVQAVKDGWGIEYTDIECLAGLQLQDRKNPKHKAKITGCRWDMGILIVCFKNGWQCLDHCINQFKIDKGR